MHFSYLVPVCTCVFAEKMDASFGKQSASETCVNKFHHIRRAPGDDISQPKFRPL